MSLKEGEFNMARISISELTNNTPFCSGVLISREVERGPQFLFTLTEPKIIVEGQQVSFVEGIGGGQETGEDTLACARREAMEEIGASVEIISSPRTIIETPEVDLSITDTVVDRIKPVVLQVRKASQLLESPFKDGLPTGNTLFITLYLAKLASSLYPTDVPAILWVDWDTVEQLVRGVPLQEVLTKGGEILKKDNFEISPNTVLKIPHPSTEELVSRAIQKYPNEVKAILGIRT